MLDDPAVTADGMAIKKTVESTTDVPDRRYIIILIGFVPSSCSLDSLSLLDSLTCLTVSCLKARRHTAGTKIQAG